MEVADDVGGTATAVATVEVSAALMLADAPLLSVALGVPVSLYTFIASGGIGIKTYTLVADDEDYFSVGVTSGVLSLLAGAQEGVHMLTVQAIDEGGRKVDALATVRVSAALMLADAPPFTVIASAAMSLHTFIASGGIGTPTYTILASNEKEGFTLNAASGVLSLVADAAVGSHTLTVQVMDARDNTAQAVATVEVSAALALAAAPPFTVIASVGMSLHTFIASGGIGAPTYTILAGNEKEGFTLNAASGVLSLSVNAEAGKYTLTVQAMDARNNAVQVLATVGVSAALELAAVSSFTVIASMAMSLRTFIASGGIGTPTYAILVGNEKEGFTLNATSGVLSLVADATVGSHTLTVQVMDARDNTADTVVTVGVSAVLSLADAQRLGGAQGTAISLYMFEAQGGIGARTYTLLTDNVENYFSLDAESGVLSLLVSATMGTYTLSVQVSDDRGNVADALATVDVAVLFLADAPPLYAVVGREVSLHTFAAKGVIGSLTYAITSGNDESYFNLDANSGVLSVRSTAVIGVYTLSVSVKDSLNDTEAVAVVEVRASLSLVAMPPLTVIAGRVAHTLAASGGIGTYTYAIVPSNEGGFAVDAVSGALSLSMNAEVRRHTLTVQVMDERGNTAQALATVEVSAVLSLAEAPSFTVIASVAMSLHTFVASGGIGIKTYALLADDAGEYFSVDAASGVFSLSMNAPVREYMLTVQAMDERDNTVEMVVTVGVSAALALVEAPSFTVIASVAMSLHTFVAGGGVGGMTYTLLAGDERYFSVGEGSGVLSLSVDAEVGRYTLTVQVMDERANTAETVATVEVSAALSLAGAPSFTVIASVAMSLHTFVASGGIGLKTYTLLAGGAGEYFSVDAASGVLSLSMNAPAREYMLTVQVKDERSNTAQAVATVGVSAALVLAEVPSFMVIASVEMSLHTFAASGGIGLKTYTLMVGDAGEYFSVDAASGVLSLSMNAPTREYTLTVQVMDERNNTAQTVVMVGVSAVLSLAEAPLLEAIEENALSLYTFAAGGGIGSRTYTLLAGNDGYFSVGAESGVLSLSANAAVGRHTLTVQVMDERSNTAQVVATVGVSAALTLAAAPSFTVIASVAMSLHTFIAGGGIGRKTYTLAADDERYFSVGADSGVLSLSMNAEAGEYTLTVRAMDEHHNSIAAVVMVGVSAALALADAPLLQTVVGEAGNLHTFAATGGIGDRTYTLVAGNEDYFSLDRSSGVLSMEVTASVGMYTLSVQVADAEGNVATALATVEVAPLLLRDVMLYAIEGQRSEFVHL